MNLIIYPFIIIAALITSFIISKLWLYITVYVLNLDGKQKTAKYHFHHSLLCLVPFTAIPLIYHNPKALTFTISLALGFILEHRLTYGKFQFITKR